MLREGRGLTCLSDFPYAPHTDPTQEMLEDLHIGTDATGGEGCHSSMSAPVMRDDRRGE